MLTGFYIALHAFVMKALRRYVISPDIGFNSVVTVLILHCQGAFLPAAIF